MIESALGLTRRTRWPSAQDWAGRAECWKRSSNSCLRRRRAANQLQALIFDSWFDSYRGVVVLARVIQGILSRASAFA